jgi:hypothetical protein
VPQYISAIIIAAPAALGVAAILLRVLARRWPGDDGVAGPRSGS